RSVCDAVSPGLLADLGLVDLVDLVQQRVREESLRANVLETPTPFEFSVEGGEVLSNGIQE
ncbi:MAG: hypothetical protein ACRD1P_09490, partial [Thermoanaerobaculia bacterium]